MLALSLLAVLAALLVSRGVRRWYGGALACALSVIAVAAVMQALPLGPAAAFVGAAAMAEASLLVLLAGARR